MGVRYTGIEVGWRAAVGVHRFGQQSGTLWDDTVIETIDRITSIDRAGFCKPGHRF